MFITYNYGITNNINTMSKTRNMRFTWAKKNRPQKRKFTVRPDVNFWVHQLKNKYE